MISLPVTTEVRWFFPGEIPDDIQTWFNSLGSPSKQPTRTDIYFPLSRPGIGIKLREGRIEFKVRRTRHGSQKFAPGVSGQVEKWVKWGFRSPGGLRSGLRVEKVRQILYYQVTEDGEVFPSIQGVLPKQGGGVELTQVCVHDSPWWTLGIEVFGPEQMQVKVLDAIAAMVFRVDGVPTLSSDSSISYSAWLIEMSLRS